MTVWWMHSFLCNFGSDSEPTYFFSSWVIKLRYLRVWLVMLCAFTSCSADFLMSSHLPVWSARFIGSLVPMWHLEDIGNSLSVICTEIFGMIVSEFAIFVCHLFVILTTLLVTADTACILRLVSMPYIITLVLIRHNTVLICFDRSEFEFPIFPDLGCGWPCGDVAFSTHPSEMKCHPSACFPHKYVSQTTSLWCAYTIVCIHGWGFD